MGSRILGGAIGGVIEAGFTGFEETLLRQMTPPIWVACTLAAAVVYCITEKPAGVTDQDAALMPFILPKLFLLCLVALFVLAYAIYS